MATYNLKVGSKNISKMTIGNRIADTVYFGNEKVYENVKGLIISESEVNNTITENVAKLEKTTVIAEGEVGSYTYDETPTGKLEILPPFVQSARDITIDGGTLAITGDRGALSNIEVNGGTLAIKPTNGTTISGLNIHGGTTYLITDDLDLDINISGGNLYLVVSNSAGTINISGGTVYLHGQDNDIELNINGGDIYYGTSNSSNLTDGVSILTDLYTNFAGKEVSDVYYDEELYMYFVYFSDDNETSASPSVLELW